MILAQIFGVPFRGRFPRLVPDLAGGRAGWAALCYVSHRLNCCAENESEWFDEEELSIQLSWYLSRRAEGREVADVLLDFVNRQVGPAVVAAERAGIG
eukprot:1440578-Amphidinium_carterae.1